MPEGPKLSNISGMLQASVSSARQLAEMAETREAIARAQAEEKFAGSAGGAARSLFDHIREFEAQTDTTMEVGVRLVSFGQAVTFRVIGVGYTQPNLVWFEGQVDDGSSVRLIQHLSQLSFLLMRVPRVRPEAPRVPIGFHQ